MFRKKLSEISNYYPLFFTVVFIFILIQYSFSIVDAIFYDLWVKYDFGISHNNNVVIVTLDEESDELLGENFPYTYATHNRFLERLFEEKPAVVSYLMNLGDVELSADNQDKYNFKEQVQQYSQSGGSFRFGTIMDYWGEQLPPRELQPLGYSLSLLNIDNIAFARDDVARRALLNVSGDDTLDLWIANEFRQKKGLKKLSANTILGAYYVREADATFTLFRYFSNPLDKKAIKTIPFHKVVNKTFPRGFFHDKIVLIGSKYISSSSDFILTPFNKEKYNASQLNVHAQIIQSLIQDKTVLAIPEVYTSILSVIIALILSYMISRMRPTRGLLLTMVMMLSLFMIAYLMFCVMGLWLNITHLVLTVFVVYYIWVPFKAIGEYQKRYATEEETKLLKKVDSLKQNFISLMSHDLKTPVAKIAGIADIMMNQFDNNPDQTRHLNSIVGTTKDLNRYITSILDLTKIESQNLNLRKTSKDINVIMEQVLEGLKFEAQQSDINFDVNQEPLYPITLDMDLIKRVFANLVENAIKYSGRGKTVSISTWDDDDWVYIKISDNGVGIPEDDLEHIFDKFYRVKNDHVHAIKGTGLGLYLVKYFIELHEGSITAESKLGEGTSFLIKLKNA